MSVLTMYSLHTTLVSKDGSKGRGEVGEYLCVCGYDHIFVQSVRLWASETEGSLWFRQSAWFFSLSPFFFLYEGSKIC